MAETGFFGDAEVKLMGERQESDASTALPTFVRERCISGFSVDSDFAYEKHEEQEQLLLTDFNIRCEVQELEKLPGVFELMEPLVSQATAKHRVHATSAGRGSDLLPIVAVLSVTVLGASFYPAIRYSMITLLAAIALPGIYLWVADGCRPEDLDMTKATWTAGPLAISVFLGCPYFLGMSFSSLVFCCTLAVASVMLLPGAYLWNVNGCRPEDFQESTSKWPLGALVFLLFLSSQYSLDMSCYSLLSCCTTCMAALMVLPGVYLWIVDGCRPEDFKESTSKCPMGALGFLLFLSCQYSMDISCYSLLSCYMTCMAALMVLPGIYLWVVDDCRPEDFQESASTQPADATRASLFLSSVYFLGTCVSSLVGFCMLCIAAVLLLPGIYLWIVDGCRPEDFQESADTWSATAIFAVLPLRCCMSISSTANYCMAGVAALMLLPGIYLWTVDGCRPEFFEEIQSSQSAGFLGLLLFLATPYFLGMSALSVVLYSMAGVAALLLVPGIYLWIADGCRPEDYQVTAGTWPVECLGAMVFFCCLYFLGMSVPSLVACCMLGAAAIMVLPGVYMWTVDGCRPEDFQESVSNLPARFLGALMIFSLPYFLGMPVLSLGGYFVTGMAALTFLPGTYLWIVDGCRPEDFRESASVCPVGFLAVGVFLMYLVFAGVSWYALMGFAATGVAAVMLLPGINLWIVDGCRPEDF